MRTHRTGLAVALSLLISLAAVGQQEPVIDPFDVALAEAARQNNFAEFDRLYQANPLAPYAELHRLWSWSMNDPIGGFYGGETFERLAVAYPGFAAFIDAQKIVDSNGKTFYPTVETRAFLLSQAVRGVIAEVPRPTRPVQIAKKPQAAAPAPARVVVPALPTVAAAPKAPLKTAAVPRPAEPVRATPVAALPAVIASAPVVEVNAAPVVAASVVPPPVTTKPVSSDLGRGIFLIIAGLFGLGLVSVMLQTPTDEQTPATHS